MSGAFKREATVDLIQAAAEVQGEALFELDEPENEVNGGCACWHECLSYFTRAATRYIWSGAIAKATEKQNQSADVVRCTNPDDAVNVYENEGATSAVGRTLKEEELNDVTNTTADGVVDTKLCSTDN